MNTTVFAYIKISYLLFILCFKQTVDTKKELETEFYFKCI